MKFLIGLLLGIGIAAGVAFYLNKAQSPFVEKDIVNNSETVQGKNNASSPLVLAPGTNRMQIASSAPDSNAKSNESNTKYDFYDVLEGKKNLNSSQPINAASPTPAKINKQAASKPPSSNVQNILDDTTSQQKNNTNNNGNYILQAGAFANSNSANDLKAHLALAGYPSKIISKQNNDGTVINKVIIGPYNSLSQAQNIKSELQQQSISVTIINTNQ